MGIARRIGELLRRTGGTVPSPPAFRPTPELADIGASYRLLLGREPDRGDITALSTAIAAGWTLETIVRSVLCSQEFRARRWTEILQAGAVEPTGALPATAEDIVACYRFVLGRGPDPAGWAAHLRALRGGKGRDALLCGFLLSPEFQQRALARALKAPAARKVTMKLGFPFAVYENDDAIGAEFVRTGEFEPHVTAQFLARVRPGDVVLDIGANAGYFTVLAGRAVGPEGAVCAFEPYQANIALIHANIRLNGLGNVRVYPFALAERWGCFAAYAVDTNAGLLAFDGDPLALPVRDAVSAARLDDLLAGASRIDVVKIDVEGFEYRALAGGSSLLARHRPIIFTELLPEALRMASGVAPEKYLSFLAGLGYVLSVIREDGTLLECGPDAGRVLATIGERGGHADLLALPAR